ANACAVSARTTPDSVPVAPMLVATTGREWLRASIVFVGAPPPIRRGTTARRELRYQDVTSGTLPATVTPGRSSSAATRGDGCRPTIAIVAVPSRGRISSHSQQTASTFGA